VNIRLYAKKQTLFLEKLEASFIDTREAQQELWCFSFRRMEFGPTRAGAAEFEVVRRLRIKEPQVTAWVIGPLLTVTMAVPKLITMMILICQELWDLVDWRRYRIYTSVFVSVFTITKYTIYNVSSLKLFMYMMPMSMLILHICIIFVKVGAFF